MNNHIVLSVMAALLISPFQVLAQPILPKPQIGIGVGLVVPFGDLASDDPDEGFEQGAGFAIVGKGRLFVAPTFALVGVIEYSKFGRFKESETDPFFGTISSEISTNTVLIGVLGEYAPPTVGPVDPYFGAGLGLFIDDTEASVGVSGLDISFDDSATKIGFLFEGGIVLNSMFDLNATFSTHTPTFEFNIGGETVEQEPSWPFLALSARYLFTVGS